MQNQVSDNNSNQRPDGSWIAETGRTLLLSLLLAFGIRTFVAEARWIPSGSMEPTLHGDQDQWKADKIIVDKVSYKFSEPKRGDIVVFSPTQELKREQYNDAFIKRVVGLPGETIELSRDGKVLINNKPLQENYLDKGQTTAVEVCNSGPNQAFLSKAQTIPDNQYLVLGDNRGSSYDSRCWGLVPRENIIGRAVLRFWPLDNLGGIDKKPLYQPES